MEESVVQLEIPLKWNLWRIYQAKPLRYLCGAGDLDVYSEQVKCISGYKQWFCYRDLMDEDGFDDTTSFPALKPDLDIFGAPGRCRKQRGWHHVRRWPPAAHTAEDVEETEYATGADIPPEVIDMILEHCNDYEFDEYLGKLRLVCSRWQDHLVGKHFCYISAASTQRIRELSALQTNRLALGWEAYPILRGEFDFKLNPPSNMESWVEAVKRLGLSKDASHDLRIEGPVAPGRRLTSVYLSSPSRALWNPIPIRMLVLTDVHFKKPVDLVRLLRELPFLRSVFGRKVTWDASSEEYPRVTSFIPCTRPSSEIEYRFTDSQRGISCMLRCALTLAGQDPILQSEADALYHLAADLDADASSSEQEHFVQNPMRMHWKCGGCDPASAIVDIWMQTRPQRMLSIPWEALAAHIENLSTQPKALFLFDSTTSATLFSEHFATVPKMASLRATNRLIYILEDKDKGSLSVVKEGEDGEWITLAGERYEGDGDPRNLKDRKIVLYELITRATDHY